MVYKCKTSIFERLRLNFADWLIVGGKSVNLPSGGKFLIILSAVMVEFLLSVGGIPLIELSAVTYNVVTCVTVPEYLLWVSEL